MTDSFTDTPGGLRIGGKPPAYTDFEGCVAQLKALPSAFSKRTRVFTPQHSGPDATTEAGKAELAGLNAHYAPDKAAHYLRAATAYEADGKTFEQATMLSKAGREYLRILPPYLHTNPAAPEAAIPLLEGAMRLHQDAGQLDLAFFDCCNLYTAQSKAFLYYQSIDDTARMESMRAAMEAVRVQARGLKYAYCGGTDPDALRVEEGEMGFSADARIGTDNVSHCLTIIARDPATHKTGLAHLDYQNDIATLDAFFAQFGDVPLDVRLIGASHSKAGHSTNNLRNMMGYLQNKQVNLVSADVLMGEQAPTALVVNPHDFSVIEAVPTKTTANAAIGNAVLSFAPTAKPLELQFDLTQSPQRAPIFLTRGALGFIRKDYIGKSEAEIERFLASIHYVDRPLAVDDRLQLVAAYETEWAALNATLQRTLAAQAVDEANATRARAALEKQRFFVGENAAGANAPVHRWIQEELLKDGKCQFAAEQGIRFDEKSHRLTIKKARQEPSSGASKAS